MALEASGPQEIDQWQGTVEWIEEDRGVFVSDLYFPNEEEMVDYVEEVEIGIDQLSEEERPKLRNFLSFICTVELDPKSVSGLGKVSNIAFLPPTIITSEMVYKAAEEFAFLDDLTD